MQKKKNKERSPSVEKALRILKIIKNITVTTIFVTVVIALILTLIARVNGEVPSLFGFSVYRVSSASMVPTLEVGDIILSSECDPETLRTGDIITYEGMSGQLMGKRVTHRVVKEPYVENDGEVYLVTKGDDNPVEDTPIPISRVTGRMVTKIGFLKELYNFFVTPWGLLIVIVLIIAAFFNEILNFGRTLFGHDEEEEESIEEVIERISRENYENAKKNSTDE